MITGFRTMSDLFLRPLFDWRSAVASKYGPSHTTRHVLLTLALHMSPKGDSCYPSIELLVEESGLSRRAVITHLAMAEREGWIQKKERPQRNGQGWRRIEYLASIPNGLEASARADLEERGAPDAPPQRGARQSKGGAPHAEGGAPRAPEFFMSTPVIKNIEPPAPDLFASRAKPELPPYIDPDLWETWMEIRKSKKAVNSDRALKIILKELAQFQTAGFDCNAIIKRSIVGSWTSVYAPDGFKPTTASAPKGMPRMPEEVSPEVRAAAAAKARKAAQQFGRARVVV